MPSSAGEVVFRFLIQVNCSSTGGGGGGGDDLPPGESDGGERRESHGQVCEGRERAMISSRGDDTPPDTVILPPSLSHGSNMADSWEWTLP